MATPPRVARADAGGPKPFQSHTNVNFGGEAADPRIERVGRGRANLQGRWPSSLFEVDCPNAKAVAAAFILARIPPN
jgi:hypothetical protein